MPVPLLSLLVPALGAPAAGLGLACVRRRRAANGRRRDEHRRRERDERREALRTATGGRLRWCEPDEVRAALTGERLWSLPLLGPEDVSRFRRDLREIAGGRGFAGDRLDALCSCVSEAAGGALGRGQGGVAQVWASEDGLSVLVTDCGRGITPESLLGLMGGTGTPSDAVLERGDGPLAFQILLALSDTVALSTGDEGTQLLLHVRRADQSAQAESSGGPNGVGWVQAA